MNLFGIVRKTKKKRKVYKQVKEVETNVTQSVKNLLKKYKIPLVTLATTVAGAILLKKLYKGYSLTPLEKKELEELKKINAMSDDELVDNLITLKRLNDKEKINKILSKISQSRGKRILELAQERATRSWLYFGKRNTLKDLKKDLKILRFV